MGGGGRGAATDWSVEAIREGADAYGLPPGGWAADEEGGGGGGGFTAALLRSVLLAASAQLKAVQQKFRMVPGFTHPLAAVPLAVAFTPTGGGWRAATRSALGNRTSDRRRLPLLMA